MFNLAIDSKLRGCDLVGLRVRDVVQGARVAPRAIVMQKKTQRPVQFEITEQTRGAVATWVKRGASKPGPVPNCGRSAIPPRGDIHWDSLVATPLSVRARRAMKSSNTDRANPCFRASAYARGSSSERVALYRRVKMNASADEANGVSN